MRILQYACKQAMCIGIVERLSRQLARHSETRPPLTDAFRRALDLHTLSEPNRFEGGCNLVKTTMKHGVAFRKFSRTSSHRMLMLRSATSDCCFGLYSLRAAGISSHHSSSTSRSKPPCQKQEILPGLQTKYALDCSAHAHNSSVFT